MKMETISTPGAISSVTWQFTAPGSIRTTRPLEDIAGVLIFMESKVNPHRRQLQMHPLCTAWGIISNQEHSVLQRRGL